MRDVVLEKLPIATPTFDFAAVIVGPPWSLRRKRLLLRERYPLVSSYVNLCSQCMKAVAIHSKIKRQSFHQSSVELPALTPPSWP